MTAWEKLGTISAVIAAVAGIVAIVVTWVLGKRAIGDARLAVTYERLAEARRLAGQVRYSGDNARWSECHEAQAQLRAVLSSLNLQLPDCDYLASSRWNPDTYSGTNEVVGLQNAATMALAELEHASTLLTSTR